MTLSIIAFSLLLGVSLAYPIYDPRRVTSEVGKIDFKRKQTDCQLRNGAIGVCKPIKDCPGALQVIKNRFGTPSAYIRCGFEGNVEIICCSRTQNRNDDKDDKDTIHFPTTVKHPTKRPPNQGSRGKVTPKPPPVQIKTRIASNECERLKTIMPVSVVTHIIDGDEADEGEFPHMAALGYLIDGNVDFDCGGTLISERYVVTAAHCIINNKRVRPHVVRMGTLKLDGTFDTSDTDYEIEEIKIHPSYTKRSRYNDIALLKLSKPVTLSGHIFPACLYTNDDDPRAIMTIAGWGMTDAKTTSKSNSLLKANLRSVSRSSCNAEYSTQTYESLANGIVEQQICAADPQVDIKDTRFKDTCTGDSGGPLQMSLNGMSTLVGITSFSQGECGSGTSGVYTRVSKFLDWIESEVWPTDQADIRFE